jgi:arylformamidase
MARIIDLSMPIEDHFRWSVERRRVSSHAAGDTTEKTWLGWMVHGFTHMDSPRHFFPDGATTSDIALETTVGEAAVVDLADIHPNEPIGAERLAKAAGHVLPGDIVVMKTTWERTFSPRTPDFWTQAPFVTREGAEWLHARKPRAVAFDFPQDFVIRKLLQGESPPAADNVTHDVLLRDGIILIEYLANTVALTRPRTFLVCLPLKVDNADGAPARVIALEDGPA